MDCCTCLKKWPSVPNVHLGYSNRNRAVYCIQLKQAEFQLWLLNSDGNQQTEDPARKCLQPVSASWSYLQFLHVRKHLSHWQLGTAWDTSGRFWIKRKSKLGLGLVRLVGSGMEPGVRGFRVRGIVTWRALRPHTCFTSLYLRLMILPVAWSSMSNSWPGVMGSTTYSLVNMCPSVQATQTYCLNLFELFWIYLLTYQMTFYHNRTKPPYHLWQVSEQSFGISCCNVRRRFLATKFLSAMVPVKSGKKTWKHHVSWVTLESLSIFHSASGLGRGLLLTRKRITEELTNIAKLHWTILYMLCSFLSSHQIVQEASLHSSRWPKGHQLLLLMAWKYNRPILKQFRSLVSYCSSWCLACSATSARFVRPWFVPGWLGVPSWSCCVCDFAVTWSCEFLCPSLSRAEHFSSSTQHFAQHMVWQ